MRMGVWASLSGLMLLTIAGVGFAATGISYSTTFVDETGTVKTITFQGAADGSALTGTLQVAGESRQVAATVGPDGSVSGKLLRPDGSQLGVFWGQRVGKNLKGNFDLGGAVGEWTAPANKLPLPR